MSCLCSASWDSSGLKERGVIKWKHTLHKDVHGELSFTLLYRTGSAEMINREWK